MDSELVVRNGSVTSNASDGHESKIEEDFEHDLLKLLQSDLLTCCVCHQRGDELLLQPCLHVVCSTCVSSHSEQTRCPLCSSSGDETTPEPHEAHLSKPTDTVKATFINGLQQLALLTENNVERECDYCQYDGQFTPAKCLCVNCGDHLCTPCSESHRRTKLTRLHTLLKHEDIRQSKWLSRIRQAPPPLCMDHADDELMESDTGNKETLSLSETSPPVMLSGMTPQASAYCEQCQAFLCADCAGQFAKPEEEKRHSRHSIVTLDTVVRGIRHNLDSLLQKVKRRKTNALNHKCDTEKYGSDLKQREMDIVQQIDQRASALHDQIDRIAEQIKQDASTRITSELCALDERLAPYKLYIERCVVAMRYTAAITEHGRPDELVQAQSHIKSCLSQLGRWAYPCLETKMDPKFGGGTLDSHIQLDDFFGTIDFNVQTISDNGSPACTKLPHDIDGDSEGSGRTDCASKGVNTSPESVWNRIPLNDFGDGAAVGSGTYMLSERSNFTLQEISSSRMGLGTARKSARCEDRLVTEFEFDARVPIDSRDVWPTGLAVHQTSSHILVSDRDNARIKIFKPNGKFVSSLGDGPIEEDRLINPFDVAVTPAAVVLVSDYQLEEVRLFSIDGQAQGTLSSEKFKHPRGIAYGLGLVAVVDSRRRQVSLHDMRTDPRTLVKRVPLLSVEGQTTQPAMTEPYYVEFLDSGSGYLAITDWAAPSLKLYSLSMGRCVGMTAGYGTGLDQMLQPYGVCYAPWTQQLLVADHVNHRIQSTTIDCATDVDGFIDRSTGPQLGYAESVQRTIGLTRLGPVRPVADKSTNAVWHPMALTTDVNRQRVIVSEALGNIKVLRTGDSI